MTKTLIYVFLAFFPYAGTSTQDGNKTWIETKAKITEVHNNVKARGTRSFASVTYLAEDGKEYQSRVELLAIPFIGTMKSVNDSVTVYYDTGNPFSAKSPEASFLESYGLYLLIGAGILITLYNFRMKFRGGKT